MIWTKNNKKTNEQNNLMMIDEIRKLQNRVDSLEEALNEINNRSTVNALEPKEKLNIKKEQKKEPSEEELERARQLILESVEYFNNF